jgi:hypothetical protein
MVETKDFLALGRSGNLLRPTVYDGLGKAKASSTHSALYHWQELIPPSEPENGDFSTLSSGGETRLVRSNQLRKDP